MSVINYIDPFMGNSSTFAPKENHNRITPLEHMLQKVNSKNEMEKAAYSDGYAERGHLPTSSFYSKWYRPAELLPCYPQYFGWLGCVHPSA